MDIGSFEEISVTGESHQREFTYGCKMGQTVCQGKGSTKKEAKKAAAKKMLDLLNGMPQSDDSIADSDSVSSASSDVPCIIPLVELRSVEEVMEEYRKLRKPYIKPVRDGLRYRQNYFLKLPEDNRKMAQAILASSDFLSASEVVDQVFMALNIKYTVDRVQNDLRFALINCDFDCVFCEKPDELYDIIVNYLKTMLNAQNVDEAIGAA